MNRQTKILISFSLLFTLTACTNDKSESKTKEKTIENNKIFIQINDKTLTAHLVDNKATKDLKEIISKKGLTINFHNNGGFEQVGSIGQSLPTNDTQISATSGDILLYNGNQIVMFYGDNSWSYTRIGKIKASQQELAELFGDKDMTATFTLKLKGA